MKYKVMPVPSVSNPATHDTEEAGSAVNLSFAEEFSSPFKLPVLLQGNLTLPERFNARATWKRAFVKIKMKRAVQKVNDEIMTYGTNELLADNVHYKDNIDNLLDRKVQKREAFRLLSTKYMEKGQISGCLLHPDSGYKKAWNGMMAVLLVYTAIIIPFRTAFEEPIYWDFWTSFELILDFCFLTDMLVTLCSSYYRDDTGELVQNRKDIIWTYMRSWFLVDLVSSFPFSLLDLMSNDTSNYNTTTRLTRLSRLYKLARISRIAKAIKFSSKTDCFSKVQDYLHMNSRVYKLVKFLLMVSVAVHICACFWFFTWKLEDSQDSWVVRYGYADSGRDEQYLAAVYWAVVTIVTVGYGDITAKTELEMTLAILWMIIGVGFYSFTIGSLSSFLTSIDTRESVLSSKMAAIQEFASETGISPVVKSKIRAAVRYHTWKTGSIWNDKHSLFTELPKRLQYEVATSMYHGVVQDLPFFSSRNQPFLIYFAPLFKPMRFVDGEFVYRQGDHADEVLFVTKGRVNLVLNFNDVVYKSYVRRSYFGDIEVVKRISRLDNTKTCGECEFLSVSKRDFLQTLEEFPGEAKKIKEIAEERLRKHRSALLQTYEVLRLRLGSSFELRDKERLMCLQQTEEDEGSVYTQIGEKMAGVEAEVGELVQSLSGLKGTFRSLVQVILAKGKKTSRRRATLRL